MIDWEFEHYKFFKCHKRRGPNAIYSLGRFGTKKDMDRYEIVERDFIKNNNIGQQRIISAYIDIEKLLTTGREHRTIGKYEGILHIDHARYFKIKNGPRFILYCPYGPTEQLMTDKKWAEERGIYCEIHGPETSIYGCGSSMVIMSKTPIKVKLWHPA